jgi:excinuclease ABC subunit C
LILFFEGKKKQLRTKLEKEMNVYAKNMEFEEAQKVKRLLYALDHVNDMALIKQEEKPSSNSPVRNFRIEAYDIAHLSGTNVVGAFTVSINGELVPAEYRKFNISRQENNDIAGLVEILSRRLNHTEWTYPDLIIVDGAEGQLRAAEAVLRARRISIPIVAVTKDERHKASEIIGNQEFALRYQSSIIRLNTEAHRFVITFHKKKRKAGFLL